MTAIQTIPQVGTPESVSVALRFVRQHLGARIAITLLAGLSLGFAFPPFGWWWGAPLSVAMLTVVAAGSKSYRGSFGWGWLGEIVGGLIITQWLHAINVGIWFFAVLILSLWVGMLLVAIRFLIRHLRWWPLPVAALWVLQEALRGRFPLGGWPWGELAFSQSAAPTLGVAAIGGAPAITFVVALAGTLVAWAVLTFDPGSSLRPLAATVCAAGVLFVGVLVPHPAAPESAGGASTATVALIQSGTPLGTARVQPGLVLGNQIRQTQRLATDVRAGRVPAPDLVLWPESSSALSPFRYDGVAQTISTLADELDVPILIGVQIDNPAEASTSWNAGVLWLPHQGAAGRYYKRSLVPFGEYVPLKDLMPDFLLALRPNPNHEYVAGDQPGVFDAGPIRLGDLICWDVAFSQPVRDSVEAGARVLALQSNSAAFMYDGPGGDSQPLQQAATAQVRAVESGRTIMSVSTAGFTGVVDASGRIVTRIPPTGSDYLVTDVALRDTTTIATVIGGWVEFGISLAALLILVVVAARARNRPADATPETSDDWSPDL